MVTLLGVLHQQIVRLTNDFTLTKCHYEWVWHRWNCRGKQLPMYMMTLFTTILVVIDLLYTLPQVERVESDNWCPGPTLRTANRGWSLGSSPLTEMEKVCWGHRVNLYCDFISFLGHSMWRIKLSPAITLLFWSKMLSVICKWYIENI